MTTVDATTHALRKALLAFISMLLFWAFIVAAAQEAPSMISLILAVGMAIS